VSPYAATGYQTYYSPQASPARRFTVIGGAEAADDENA
jgi:hypothetical protein